MFRRRPLAARRPLVVPAPSPCRPRAVPVPETSPGLVRHRFSRPRASYPFSEDIFSALSIGLHFNRVAYAGLSLWDPISFHAMRLPKFEAAPILIWWDVENWQGVPDDADCAIQSEIREWIETDPYPCEM
ncbi:unnamed protein product [Cochlearia groenlandica]